MKTLLEPSAVEEIIQRLQALRPDSPRKWGKMNAHQMVCHLADAFLGTTGRKPVSMKTGLFQRTVMKFFALRVPAPWPHGIPTMPEMDQLLGGTPPVEFNKDRDALIAAIKPFLDAKKVPHPIFDAMDEWEWARWGYLHMDHHLRQFNA